MNSNMQIIGKNILGPCVATIGTFDGVHKGHQFVLRQVFKEAHKNGFNSLVFTFSNHPLEVLSPESMPKQLSLLDEKTELILSNGIDSVAISEFTEELSMYSAKEFMQKILKEQLNVKILIIGYDNHFGHDKKSFNDYVVYGKEMGIKVLLHQELHEDFKASSSLIRNLLAEGDVNKANLVLGYNYYMQGKVINGFHIGKKIGFPTANIEVDNKKLIPMNGAYMVRASFMFNGKENSAIGMMNIGFRPTLGNGSQQSIEVHLFDFFEDIYGKMIKIEFLHFIRKEKRFNNIEELKEQLKSDEEICRYLAHKY